MLKGPCNKHHFFAHLQIDPLDNGDAEKNWTDGVQKSDVCCTGLFGINYRPANCVFLMAGERVQ
jgi:hypothetical protein